ncbi:MAG: formyltetrahydrofolate deformylase [Actinomycetota bacterium]|jgi:formyltetrahydrofolate deformylase|nr:formyltetrahydrofolate deformylase [Actinomycetota bacterium]
MEPGPTAVLLLVCPDQPGLVAAVAQVIASHHGNIVHAEQHIDRQSGRFFQRVEFELEGLDLERSEIAGALRPVVERFAMQQDLRFSDEVPRLALLVSRQPHCLYDQLARWRMGELRAEVPVVISNHEDHADGARAFGIDYAYLPVDPDDPASQEVALLDALRAYEIDVVVMARYMRILSPTVIAAFPNRVINIHHSFLPAFTGARPYHQAHERGVKLIGATAHYATDVLDEGPIIDQDVARVSHRDAVDDLVRKGRDLEKTVLGRAVHRHLEHRVIVYGNKTVVFD